MCDYQPNYNFKLLVLSYGPHLLRTKVNLVRMIRVEISRKKVNFVAMVKVVRRPT